MPAKSIKAVDLLTINIKKSEMDEFRAELESEGAFEEWLRRDFENSVWMHP